MIDFKKTSIEIQNEISRTHADQKQLIFDKYQILLSLMKETLNSYAEKNESEISIKNSNSDRTCLNRFESYASMVESEKFILELNKSNGIKGFTKEEIEELKRRLIEEGFLDPINRFEFMFEPFFNKQSAISFFYLENKIQWKSSLDDLAFLFETKELALKHIWTTIAFYMQCDGAEIKSKRMTDLISKGYDNSKKIEYTLNDLPFWSRT